MTARISKKQAKQLGLDLGELTPPKTKTGRNKTEPYWSQCTTCDAIITTKVGEDRHLAETGHARYSVLHPDDIPAQPSETVNPESPG